MSDNGTNVPSKNDYISLEDAEQFICEACERPGCPRLWGNDCEVIYRLNKIPAANVRPVAEIDDAVYDAVYYLNSVSSQMPYHVYSALFDLICGIFQTCGADMREPNLDTTKGEGRD